jgi:hypothetical protein
MLSITKSRRPYKDSAARSKKISLALQGENNGGWKGYDYPLQKTSLHQWIRRQNPPPDRCVCCKELKTKLDLANITGVYNREFINWIYLCRVCHLKLDNKWNVRDKNGRFIR